MQSGITASEELQTAFTKFVADTNAFALPVTIQNEKLTPLEPVSGGSSLQAGLSKVQPLLKPKEPLFLLVRRKNDSSGVGSFVAVTYIPSIAPVRSKTLFASTRATLVRELGPEKFGETLFCTEPDEVLDLKQWNDKSNDAGVDISLLSVEERELQSVKRAEEEERHGTAGRDLMGEGGSGLAWSSGKDAGAVAGGTQGSGVRMKIEDDALSALQEFAKATKDSGDAEGRFLQLGINTSTEKVALSTSKDNVSPADVSKHIPSGHPSYTFYHFPSTQSTLFIYVCPANSKVKERMMYASSRNGVVQMAQSQGLVVSRKIEAADPAELAEPRMSEELGVGKKAGEEEGGASVRQGFARPKRPGRR